MAVQLRFILEEHNIRKLMFPSGIPSTVEELVSIVFRTLSVHGEFGLLYKDDRFWEPIFQSYLNCRTAWQGHCEDHKKRAYDHPWLASTRWIRTVVYPWLASTMNQACPLHWVKWTPALQMMKHPPSGWLCIVQLTRHHYSAWILPLYSMASAISNSTVFPRHWNWKKTN